MPWDDRARRCGASGPESLVLAVVRYGTPMTVPAMPGWAPKELQGLGLPYSEADLEVAVEDCLERGWLRVLPEGVAGRRPPRYSIYSKYHQGSPGRLGFTAEGHALAERIWGEWGIRNEAPHDRAGTGLIPGGSAGTMAPSARSGAGTVARERHVPVARPGPGDVREVDPVEVVHSNRYGPLEAARLEAFESSIGARLPDDFRRFLIDHNGGRPALDHVLDAEGDDSLACLDGAYGLHDGPESRRLESTFAALRDALPAGLVAFGNDPGGNQFCIGIAGEHRGRVYFWDHEAAGLMPLGESFAEFLSRLGPDPWAA